MTLEQCREQLAGAEKFELEFSSLLGLMICEVYVDGEWTRLPGSSGSDSDLTISVKHVISTNRKVISFLRERIARLENPS